MRTVDVLPIYPPSVVKIELTCGCNLKCPFCAVGSNRNAYPRGQYKFMTVATAKQIMFQLSDWISTDKKIRIEFAVRGEGGLNPNIAKIFSITRETFPKCHMLFTTNGTAYLGSNGYAQVKELFRSGLTTMIVDTYRPVRKKVRKAFKAMKRKGRYPVLEYGVDDFTPWLYHKPDTKTIMLMEDLSVLVNTLTGKYRRQKPVIFTQGGNIDLDLVERETGVVVEPVTKAYPKMCSQPFRILTISWNGEVPLCCNDFSPDNNRLTFGSVRDNTLQNIWEGKRFRAVRTLLYRKDREFLPCCKCNSVSSSMSIMLSHATDYFPKRSNHDLKGIVFLGIR